MTEHRPLLHQPGSFWIGVGLVAEAPFMLIALLLSQEEKLRVTEYFASGLIGGATAVALVIGSFFLTAWLAHRAGF